MMAIEELKIKIYSDGARISDFKEMGDLEYIKGFTTNPSLMKQAGVSDYEGFVKEVMSIVKNKPISFEVISDEFSEMKRQAFKLADYGDNIYIKIPIMNTRGESAIPLVSELLRCGIKVNITAILTLKQVEEVADIIATKTPVVISVFAGRIADTGRDPFPLMKQAKTKLRNLTQVELLWASPRELLNIYHAEKAGCDIITILPEILKKLPLLGYDLYDYSIDTVRMFYGDAVSSGLSI